MLGVLVISRLEFKAGLVIKFTPFKFVLRHLKAVNLDLFVSVLVIVHMQSIFTSEPFHRSRTIITTSRLRIGLGMGLGDYV